MELHFASIYERIADGIPAAPALHHDGVTRTWAEFDDRAARLATVLADAGIGLDSKVAIYLYNCNEWMEAFHAATKLRAVPVNVNYRYLDDELVYLLDDSDSEAVVFHASFRDRIEQIRDRLPKVRLFVQVENDGPGVEPAAGVLEYEAAIAAATPAERIERSEDDLMFTYTGGTTGLPKGVINPLGLMVRNSVNFAPQGLGIESWPDEYSPEFARTLAESGRAPVVCPACPLMHSSGLTMGALPALAVGGCVVTLAGRSLDPAELFRLVGEKEITSIVIAGDAIARPMVHELERAAVVGPDYDLASLRTVMSAGVAWSAEVKLRMLDFIPDAVLQDACGSTEGGIGFRVVRRGDEASTNSFRPFPGLKILRDDGTEVEPGSEEIGRVATPAVSLGYYKDEAKTEAAYQEIDGTVYVLAGDFARRQEDGSIVLLGRGSSVINTGGEKVFPEEVEDVVKRFPGVADCLVVGVPHERFGSQVAAVVSLFDGGAADAGELTEFVRSRLAGYKVPREIVFVDQVPRLPNGKPDLGAAREAVLAALSRS